jgi:hypothetical protein
MTISIEGKWANLRSLVDKFTDQGWELVSCEPDSEFRFTTVELTNETTEESVNG